MYTVGDKIPVFSGIPDNLLKIVEDFEKELQKYEIHKSNMAWVTVSTLCLGYSDPDYKDTREFLSEFECDTLHLIKHAKVLESQIYEHRSYPGYLDGTEESLIKYFNGIREDMKDLSPEKYVLFVRMSPTIEQITPFDGCKDNIKYIIRTRLAWVPK